MKFVYINVDQALEIHNKIIEISGGVDGLNNFNGLISPIEFIKEDFYYPTFELKLTHLVYTIIKNHSFNDGNKRSAIGIGAMFLELNGLSTLIPKFIIELENIVVYVAANFISKDLLYEIINSILNYEYHSEGLKLAIYNALIYNEQCDFENKGPNFYINLF